MAADHARPAARGPRPAVEGVGGSTSGPTYGVAGDVTPLAYGVAREVTPMTEQVAPFIQELTGTVRATARPSAGHAVIGVKGG